MRAAKCAEIHTIRQKLHTQFNREGEHNLIKGKKCGEKSYWDDSISLRIAQGKII